MTDARFTLSLGLPDYAPSVGRFLIRTFIGTLAFDRQEFRFTIDFYSDRLRSGQSIALTNLFLQFLNCSSKKLAQKHFAQCFCASSPASS
jgi:hypothetical protein